MTNESLNEDMGNVKNNHSANFISRTNESMKEEWEKEFDEKFDKGSYWVFEDGNAEPIKDFITQLLKDHQESLIQKLEGEKKLERWTENATPIVSEENLNFNAGIDRAIEIIKQRKTQ